jgi:hypothetical protein
MNQPDRLRGWNGLGVGVAVYGQETKDEARDSFHKRYELALFTYPTLVPVIGKLAGTVDSSFEIVRWTILQLWENLPA